MKNLSRMEKAAFACFLFWLGAGVVITPLRIGPENVMSWQLPESLRLFIAFCLRWGDPILMLLAAVNTWLISIHYWNRDAATRWLFAALTIGGIVETIGTLTGFPFGAYYYTAKFGPMIAGVLPAAIPLAWYVVLTQILFITRIIMPHWNDWLQVVVVATAAAVFDGIMEPFATSIKGYWIWQHNIVPCRNYIAWWIVSFLLVSCFAPTIKIDDQSETRPLFILGGIVFLFIEARLVYGV